MNLIDTLTKDPLFNKNGDIALSQTDVKKILLGSKTEGDSILDTYIKSVVLPCGTVFIHNLEKLQRESKQRLGYKVSENWENTLRERLTWHDVVLWLMLVDLSEEYGYQPMHEELEILQVIYRVCSEREARKFKTIYGMLNLPL